MGISFPPRGSTPDQFGYPHYKEILQANNNLNKNYQLELLNRKKNRLQKLKSRKNIKNHLISQKKNLKELFHLKDSKSKPQINNKEIFHNIIHKNKDHYSITEYQTSNNDYSIYLTWKVIKDLSVLNNQRLLIILPAENKIGAGLESFETIFENNKKYLKDGYTILIPFFNHLDHFSSTINKKRIIQGSSLFEDYLKGVCTLLQSITEVSYLKDKEIILSGHHLSGTIAIVTAIFHSNIYGLIIESPLEIACSNAPEAYLIPSVNHKTDLSSLLFCLDHQELYLYQAPELYLKTNLCKALKNHHILKASPSNKKNKIFYSLKKKRKNESPKAYINTSTKPALRKNSIENIRTKSQLKNFQNKLKKEFLEKLGIKKISNPLDVKKIHTAETDLYIKTEYHIETQKNCIVNAVTIFPKNNAKKLPTIVCLPGSASDVAKSEETYANEIISRGWNAIIIDARVAIYPFHPSINEGKAIIAQSISDLLSCSNWLFKLKEVDVNKVAVMGGSQGGTHSWMLSAIDQRFIATAPMVGFSTYEAISNQFVDEYYDGNMRSFLDSHSIYYYIPAIHQIAEQQDLCALIFPRNLMILAANRDNCFPINGIESGINSLINLCKKLKMEVNFDKYIYDAPHSYREDVRTKAYLFFEKVFRRKKVKL